MREFLFIRLPRARLLALCLLFGSVSWSQENSDRRTIVANYNDADIRQIIAAVAKITGEKFVIHPDVNAGVTYKMSTSVTEPEFYDIFLSILHSHGYETAPRDGIIYVVPVGVEPGTGSAPLAASKYEGLLGGSVRPTSYYVNGQFRGVKVYPYPGRDRAKFDAFGFERGDLIVEYDDFPLNDESSIDHFFQSLRAEKVKHLTVVRNDTQIVIRIH